MAGLLVGGGGRGSAEPELAAGSGLAAGRASSSSAVGWLSVTMPTLTIVSRYNTHSPVERADGGLRSTRRASPSPSSLAELIVINKAVDTQCFVERYSVQRSARTTPRCG